MVTIEKAIFKHTYRILWLRYVTGIDLSKHCAPCLLGDYDERVAWWAKALPRMDLKPAPFYYLCGVELHYRWALNLHLAFIEKEGSIIEIDDDFIDCRIVNAERIPITNEFINWNLPQAQKKSFNTCRNWWFANWLAKTAFPTAEPSGIQGNLFENIG